MRHQIHPRIAGLEPTREQIKGQRKTYISANSATMKALNALKDRQSRGERGLPKLNAKKMNTAEFRKPGTTGHRRVSRNSSHASSGMVGICAALARCGGSVVMAPVSVVHEQVHERAGQEEQPG